MGFSVLTESLAQKASLEVFCLVSYTMKFQKWHFPYWWSLYVASYIYLGSIWLGPDSENIKKSKKPQNVGLQKSRTSKVTRPSFHAQFSTYSSSPSNTFTFLSVCLWIPSKDRYNQHTIQWNYQRKINAIWHCFHFKTVYFNIFFQNWLILWQYVQSKQTTRLPMSRHTTKKSINTY